MSKVFQFSEKDLISVQKGTKKIAEMLRPLLGPFKKTVLIKNGTQPLFFAHKGKTVADLLTFEDKYEQMGAKLLCEAADKTVELTGGGFITTVLLAEAIYSLGLQEIHSGVDPKGLLKGIECACDCLLGELTSLSSKIDSKERMLEVVESLTDGNKEATDIVFHAFQEVGNLSNITVSESKEQRTYVEKVLGFEIESGYLSPYFASSQKMVAELIEPLIFVTDSVISRAEQMVPILEKAVEDRERSLLIIARDVDAEALSTLVLNKLKGGLSLCAIQLLDKDLLKDIAAFTGATFFSEDMGMELKDVKKESFGNAEKVLTARHKTTIIRGKASKEELGFYLESIANEDGIEERCAKLLGNLAIIRVEGEEKKIFYKELLSSMRSALLGGVVPGSGSALILAAKALKGLELKKDEQVGVEIMKKVCALEASIVSENCSRSEKPKEGVYDPAFLVKSALKNAVSIACILLSIDGR